MNLYAHDLSLLDFNFNLSDPISDPFSHRTTSFFSETAPTDDDDDEGGGGDASDGRGRNRTNGKRVERSPSPPKFRHDGTSPLPLGMDWSPPPRKWFYRVQVGLQSPEGITTTRGILRRFNDFLKLFSELKKAFPLKDLPPAPPKGFLRMKSRILLEERRCSLEDWIEKLLSDIDISRSVLVATFLELEAAARSSFNDPQLISDVNSTSGTAPSSLLQTQSDLSVVAGSSSVTSDNGNDTPYEVSELGTPRYGEDSFANLAMEHSTSDQDLDDSIDTSVKVGLFNQKSVRESLERRSRRQISGRSNANTIDKEQTSENTYGSKPLCMDGTEFFVEPEERKRDGHAQGPSTVSFGSDTSTLRVGNLCGDGSLNLPESSEAPTIADTHDNSDLKFSRAILAAFPHDERQKLNRVLITLQQRLGTAKIDIEDLIARLNQEVAVRQFLTTKVKDLEVELETTQQNCKENIQQAVLNEKERFTQMQWDMEELRRKCLDLELQLRSEQDAREHSELTKISIIQENDILIQELDVSRRQLDNLQKLHEEFEVKSKTDVKLLVKEVKSLRNSQSELKQELSRLMKEKLEVERTLQKEKRRIECAATTNAKLLHECEILRSRLQECSVNFLVEEEDKLILDTSSPSDAVDLLTTSDNRIGLLLAEAQLLAQDVESAVIAVDDAQDIKGGDRMADDELRKMLTDQFVDNARLRMQVNSVIRCALNANIKDENDGDDEDDDEEDSHLRKTVLSKFLER
ncbi:PX domain-containing protein EREX isoform X3 [Rosa chinensis]|uniref:PX domain-containing protein EREX isoform X3 n=1 Tax=Rosa chinensis TaxID=74649 RepID=UPI000D087B27|nr:PX domain-containing protein EREX isoform X3 [Rosa chinensis]